MRRDIVTKRLSQESLCGFLRPPSAVTRARGLKRSILKPAAAGVRVKPGMEPTAQPQVSFGDPSSPWNGRQPASCRPLRGLGLWVFYYHSPGAYAPGFMLSPAPQAQSGAWVVTKSRLMLGYEVSPLAWLRCVTA